jgi:hypothetical protein
MPKPNAFVLALLLSSARAGADSSAPSPKPAQCKPGESWYYFAAGCGLDAKGHCSATPPPCYEELCSCDGKTVGGCGAINVPWRAKGKCAALSSMKGWELYTWMHEDCGPQLESAIKPKMCFALVAGTNAVKEAGEIVKARITYDELKKKLAQLKPGEEITWNSTVALKGKLDLKLPGDPLKREIVDTARNLALKLDIATR